MGLDRQGALGDPFYHLNVRNKQVYFISIKNQQKHDQLFKTIAPKSNKTVLQAQTPSSATSCAALDKGVTYNISNCTTIREPPIRQSITKIDTIPGQACLGQALAQVLVVSNIRERVAKYKLHHFAAVTID